MNETDPLAGIPEPDRTRIVAAANETTRYTQHSYSREYGKAIAAGVAAYHAARPAEDFSNWTFIRRVFDFNGSEAGDHGPDGASVLGAEGQRQASETAGAAPEDAVQALRGALEATDLVWREKDGAIVDSRGRGIAAASHVDLEGSEDEPGASVTPLLDSTEARDKAWARLVKATEALRDAVAIDLADRGRGCHPADLSKEIDEVSIAKQALRDLGVDVDALLEAM